MRKAANTKKRASKRAAKEKNKLTISNSEFDWFIDRMEIESVHAKGDKVEVHFLSPFAGVEPVTITDTLTGMHLLLGNECFVLLHRSRIANMEHVRAYRRQHNHTVIMKSGKVLGVARNREDFVQASLMEYRSRKSG